MKNQKKITQLDTITTFLTKSDNFALFKFDKTKHIALEGLRNELRKSGSTIKMVKNTIFTKSINKLAASSEHGELRPFQKMARELKENTAVISLGNDWSTGMNAFAKVAKTDKSISFKFGFLDKQPYDGATMAKLAALPSKLDLMGKIIGSMKSPLSRFVAGIKFPTQKFVMVLNAKVKKG